MDNSDNNINQQKGNNPNNNVMPINQLNQNTLYEQILQQTYQNLQSNVCLININFNNMTNILSLLNLPIVIPFHPIHPLINCTTPGRDFGNNCWKCNNCSLLYSYSVPTFYCTSCDYDYCQKCVLSLQSSEIVIYNYQLNDELINFKDDYSKKQIEFYKPHIHNHPIIKILREPCFFENKLKCNFCFNDINQTEQFYYCSLCNYCICEKCYVEKDKKDEKFVDNPEYFSNNQMEKNS